MQCKYLVFPGTNSSKNSKIFNTGLILSKLIIFFRKLIVNICKYILYKTLLKNEELKVISIRKSETFSTLCTVWICIIFQWYGIYYYAGIFYKNACPYFCCSAGVGRTGTFICIDNMLRLAARENIVDVFNYVNYMRLSRYNLVENQVKKLSIFINRLK